MKPENPFSLQAANRVGGAFAAGTLATQVADALLDKIRVENLEPGARLPSEQAMALHFGVSRSVLREAIALLKTRGLLETRKGSGAYVCQGEPAPAAHNEGLTEESIQSLLNLIEVRRGIEGETAALAAVRRTPGQLAEIEYALRHIEEAVAGGEDGVDEDARFHQCIAAATSNPYWLRFTEMFAPTLRSAVKVTRANESRREDFTRQVQAEHEKIVNAIAAGDAEGARAAAVEHMTRAAERVRSADRDFWRGEGGTLARHLLDA